ncbi:hypothetical protein JTE90_011943 [Oedothorax gibbosus]|uniref:Uncharacterized protein n=1 Tax=Oedothorax gibbosus TaxID=931172 RepID=A0AAV6V1K8_9ARAC|nr:hypothetical protein JTE90_011943 [Oedothorax gibbosus]
MAFLIWLAFSFIALENVVFANDECNEEVWQPCETTLLKLRDNYRVEDHMEGDMDRFCRVAEQNGSCWNGVSHACKEKYPQISTDIATYFVNKIIFCNNETDYVSMNKRVTECAGNHQSEIENCFPGINEDNVPNLNDMCQRTVTFLYCLAEISKKHCGEDGLTFGNAYQRSIYQSFESTCNMSSIIVAPVEN